MKDMTRIHTHARRRKQANRCEVALPRSKDWYRPLACDQPSAYRSSPEAQILRLIHFVRSGNLCFLCLLQVFDSVFDKGF